MDLLSVLPDFPTKPYAHILPPLERSHISTVDLITLDTLEVAKRARVPPADVRRLSAQIIRALHHDVGFKENRDPEADEPSSSLSVDVPVFPGPTTKLDLSQWSAISTLDSTLDALLDGGIPTGYVTEVTGESGSGKTQFLLTLLLAAQLPAPRGLGKCAIYISTEAPLSTPRLSQLIEFHPYLSTLSQAHKPSLENILSINAMDLEAQDHILNYQLPVAIKRYNVGLVIIDSITANYRAEHSSHNLSGLSTRSGELARLGQMLRNLAVDENVAVVVANQVSDRIEAAGRHPTLSRLNGGAISPIPSTQQQVLSSHHESEAATPLPRSRPLESRNVELTPHNPVLQPSPSSLPSSPFTTEDDPQQQQQFDGSYLIGNPVRNEILSLLHQQRFFTGWGDTLQPTISSLYPAFQQTAQKTPALGLVWSTQIACRIALKKESRFVDWEAILEDTFVSSEKQLLPTAREQANEPSESRVPTESEEHTRAHSPAVSAPPDETDAVDEKTNLSVPNIVRDDHATTGQSLPMSTQAVTRGVRRTMKLVFAPWTAGPVTEQGEIQHEAEFEIWKGGLRGCTEDFDTI
ncbi:DNA repair protein rhp57 [Aspergillus tubingensis]